MTKKCGHVAIIGAPNAGKSTLFQVLTGLFAADEGDVTVDGLSMRTQARKALGGLLAMHGLAAGALGLPMVTTLLAAPGMPLALTAPARSLVKLLPAADMPPQLPFTPPLQ